MALKTHIIININHLLMTPHKYLLPPAELPSTRANHPLKFYHYINHQMTHTDSHFSQELF